MRKIYHTVSDWFRKRPNFNNGLVHGNFVKIDYKEILFITTSNSKNITKVVTDVNTGYDTRTLDEFDEQYSYLVRINKSYVVNVYKISQRTNWSWVYIDAVKFKVGRTYQKRLEKACNEIF